LMITTFMLHGVSVSVMAAFARPKWWFGSAQVPVPDGSEEFPSSCRTGRKDLVVGRYSHPDEQSFR